MTEGFGGQLGATCSLQGQSTAMDVVHNDRRAGGGGRRRDAEAASQPASWLECAAHDPEHVHQRLSDY